MWKDFVCHTRVRHVFLNPKIVNRDTEVQRRCHSYRGKIRCAVAARSHVIECSEIGNFFQWRQPACMYHRHPDIVDPLLTNQIVSVPDAIEDFSACNWGCSVLADYPEAFL